MRVFVTGASGFVGSAIVQELLAKGHQVLGLARSPESAAAIKAAGGEVHLGSIYDLDSIKAGVAATDGTIHTAFNHDFSKFAENCETDRKVISAMGEALAGTTKPLIITSGTALLNPGTVATEDMNPPPCGHPRVASEQGAMALRNSGLNVSLVRLPPSTHGQGDHGFVDILINLAKEKGKAAYVGDGNNRWAAGHRLDAAKLYVLALEKGTPGTYHASVEEGVPFREITATIGNALSLPIVSITPEEAPAHFGWFGHFASIDAPASSTQTQKELGWTPTQIGLIEDMQKHYF